MTRKRKRISRGTKAIDAEEEVSSRDQLEKLFEEIPAGELQKMLSAGLKLQLETVRRKNPYFKGSRRGSEHMKLSREEKRMAVRLARVFVKGFFIVQSEKEAFRQN
jgi:uncharacterized protein (DUF2384 family)